MYNLKYVHSRPCTHKPNSKILDLTDASLNYLLSFKVFKWYDKFWATLETTTFLNGTQWGCDTICALWPEGRRFYSTSGHCVATVRGRPEKDVRKIPAFLLLVRFTLYTDKYKYNWKCNWTFTLAFCLRTYRCDITFSYTFDYSVNGTVVKCSLKLYGTLSKTSIQ